jgi:hypothetical protein
MTLDDWEGLIGNRVDPDDAVRIVAPLGPSPGGGGSMPFLALDDQRQRWWLKVLNNPQGGKVLVTDHVVAQLGCLIDAPVCEVAIAHVPEELAGFEYTQGRYLEPGLAHGSRHVEDAVEIRGLAHREDDDNRRRHVGALALYDWCWGSDDQWLYSETRHRMMFSHDHGHYLPNGPVWSVEDLATAVDQAHLPPYPLDGLDTQALVDTAAKLERVSRDQIQAVLLGVPSSWPVSDAELEALGWFLERRSGPVAARLRDIAGGGS